LKPNLIGSVAVASDPVAAEPPHAAVTASASVVPRTPAIRPSRAGTPARVMIRPLSNDPARQDVDEVNIALVRYA
jgi:hypothetical protein